ncbi:tetratricopeptide repeat protein [Thiorhodococcus fuscus]|uniref:protein O-GlcNAc transferase n=1 Tax=Thiorhodococcus fuscus TaxID=527200 RepID=A0ABW4YA28_9GAMM
MKTTAGHDVLAQAIVHHEAGRLEVAGHLYRAVLELDDAHVEAHHHLGVLEIERGHIEAGLSHLQQALEGAPETGHYWQSFAEALLLAGRSEDALVVIEQALTSGLDTPAAHDLHARIQAERVDPVQEASTVLDSTVNRESDAASKYESGDQSASDTLLDALRTGQLPRAKALARELTEADPTNALGWKVLGTLLVRDDESSAALPVLEEAHRLAPEDVEILNSLGQAYRALERLDESLEVYGRALALRADLAEVWYNQGIVQQELGRLDDALVSYSQAVRLRPGHAKAYNNLGMVQQGLGLLEEALGNYDRAIRLHHDYAEAYDNFGTLLRERDRSEEALACYDRALKVWPDNAEAFNNRALVQQDLGRVNDALQSFDAALAIKPGFVAAWSNRGNVLKDQGRLDEALASYERALAIQPDSLIARQNRLLCLNYQASLSRETLFAEHQAFESWQAAKIDRLPPVITRNSDPDRRLRIGFVSADFWLHSVAFFLLPVLERLDRQSFEVYAYATSIKQDALTREFRRQVDWWIPCSRMGHEALAERIRADEIDLLLDLSGHTSGNALPTFAAKPAPVQVTWIGYPNTTGLSAMDYRLVDAITDPPGEADDLHTERLIRLPDGFLCYRPVDLERPPPVAPPPCLEVDRITFGSFNNLAKLTAPTLALWVGVLRAVPGSRLRLKSSFSADLSVWERVIAYFERHDIAPERLEILPRTASQRDHLDLYQGVDIALDTFPYHGTTTTCEALFMGVPVVTLLGDRHASRVGGSLLTQVGLPKLIAKSEDDYVRIAVDLAADRERLGALRAGLRTRLEQSPLRDEVGFTRTLERALRRMWQIWCAGGEPRVFDISERIDSKETSFDPIQDRPPVPNKSARKLKKKQKKKHIKHHAGVREASGDGERHELATHASPGMAERTLVLGLFRQEHYADAEVAARRLTERYPQAMFGWKALGTILIKSSQYDAALPMLLEAIRLSPGDAESIHNLGFGLLALGRLNEAVGCFKRALEVKEDYALAYNNLGTAYKDLGQLDEAMACYDRALEIDPEYAEAYCNRGVVLEQAGSLNEAVTNYRKALALQPRYPQVQNNLGNSYKSLGWLDQAIACYRQALDDQPEFVAAFENLLLCLNYRVDLSSETLLAEHQAFERHIADQVLPLPPVAREGRDPEQVLRIGFVSGDFRLHSVAFFLLPIVEHLDREQFQVFCYFRAHQRDAVTMEFRRLADVWIDCASLPEQALAERIRADGIDLLLDLSGHTNPNALLTFAAKPAPVQITWIGYPNTTGLSAMDYRLVDAVTDPVGEVDAYHTECLIRLPHGFLCYRPWTSALELPVGLPPCLGTGRITFGSFNNLAKLTDATLDLWIDVMRAVPDAQLLLKSHTASDTQVWERLVTYFGAQGIAPGRLEILPRAPSYLEHLEQYQRIDIALDTFPYHGTTTTCEALLMGVPVVTLMGDRHAARVSGSLLTQAGLPELIARSASEYVEIAKGLACGSEHLTVLRQGLREHLERSSLRDEAGFTRTLESALRQMWRIWCAGERPRVFEVVSSDRSPADKKKHLSEAITPAPEENPWESVAPALANHQPCSPSRAEQDELIERFNQGRYAEAEALARGLTEQYPKAMFGWKSLGTILVKSNRHEAALPPLLEANRLAPGNAECLNSLGNALQNLGRLDEALTCFKRALENDPDYAVAYNNLGVVLSLLGRFDTAVPAFDRALAIDPQADDAHLNRALALSMLRQPDEALDAFAHALKIRPDSVDALNKRGILLQNLGRLDEARASLGQALAIKPDAADVLTNLGNLFKSQARLDEALDCYQRASTIQPDLVESWHNRLLCLNYHANIPRDQVFAEHRAFERSLAATVIPLPLFTMMDRDPERRLRIGFVSGDLRQHPVAFFLRPVLERLDRKRFQIFCYTTSLRRDDLTRVLRGLTDVWHECAGLGSRAIANRIRADAIDLLFDLSGHTEGNALLSFAARPAPVQISWIGYPNTTGLAAMDYRLVDDLTDPPGDADAYHSECLIRLPEGFLCYRPLEVARNLPLAPSPCLENGFITFGSFNNLAKLTPDMIDLWGEILERTPESRLLLKSHTVTELQVWNQWLARFSERGIDLGRLEVLPRAPSHEEHLAQYQRIDIALDTFPYHGTTTTCEALFMGVPVVTLAGDRHASRVGISLLTRVGLPELIATSAEDYVRIAVDLTTDTKRLSGLRAGLRERLEQSPLRDEIGFTRTLEAALRQMWRIWCAGESARVFSLANNGAVIDRGVSIDRTEPSGHVDATRGGSASSGGRGGEQRQASKPRNQDSNADVDLARSRKPTPSISSEQKAVLRHFEQGDYAKAEAGARRLTKRDPQALFGWKILGAIHMQSKRYQEALPILLEANRLAPDDDACIGTLGSALQHLGRLGEALACFERVAEMRPDDAMAQNTRGMVLCDLGRFAEALGCYDRALAIAPDSTEVLANRGFVMRLMGRAEEALACFDRILKINPDAIDALNKGAILARELGRLDEALGKLDRALAIAPDYAEALTNRGNVLKDQGCLDEALDCYNRALAVKPDLIVAWHVRLLCLNYQVDLTPAQVFAEHCAFERNLAVKVAQLPTVSPTDRDPERRLRIGFVSGDFLQHSVAFFLMPVLEHLDRQRFEVFCYMTRHHRDSLTQVFRGLADGWRDCSMLDAQSLARRIRQDDVDLLLDLSGHTSGNALLAFAARPAPVQITWIGYPNTTGLAAMDYRLVDAVTDPPGEADACHSERLIRLPEGFLCYRPLDGAAEIPVGLLPCLKNERITFGSFNNLSKINAATIRLWADVLRRVPRSRLRLKTPTTTERWIWDRLILEFDGAGIASDRIELLPRDPTYLEHLAQYHHIDIALDTFPYQGTTTTCEALYMGVPVVTQVGDRHVSRVGASLLTRVGLPELIATSADDYVRIATDLAADMTRLGGLRESLRERLEQSPLRDEIGFTRTLEGVLYQMWTIWCAGEPARVFEVTPARPPVESGGKTDGQPKEATVIALFEQGRLTEAEVAARELTERNPEAMFGWKALGTILGKCHRSEAAVPILRRALKLAPRDAETLDTLGKVLLDLNRLDEAIDCLGQAVAIRPDFAVAHNNLGSVLERQGHLTEAMDSYSRALSIWPEYAEAYSNLGTVLKNLGRLDDALACYERALEIRPGAASIQSNRLLCLNYQADISREQIFAEHHAYERQHAARIERLPSTVSDRDPERPLRLGLVSADLRYQSVAFFLRPILEHLDRRRFQVFCYSKSHRRDELTLSLERLVDSWCDGSALSDEALARRIQSDRIDILLDLSGHTSGNALPTFAAKPAPVQVTWIGYPNTTGLSAMDYRLVDALTDPVGEADAYHCECLIRLPGGFLCYRPAIEDSDLSIGLPPSQRNGYVTFGSFNTLAKISPITLDLWGRVLQTVPESRLHLKSSRAADINAWSRVLDDLEARGIARWRIEILPLVQSYQGHLALYQHIDIALDTFPYQGTTTTCEALFMGVPVITLAGDRHASRVGVSLLTQVGLPELIAASAEDYVRIAKTLASDPQRLANMRVNLRQRLEQSPLRDEVEFTRSLEQALLEMWRIWCAGEPPRTFDLGSDSLGK